MNRREVLLGAAAASVVAALPVVPAAAATVTQNPANLGILAKIAAAAPVMDLKDSVGMVHSFHMTANKKSDDTIGFTILKQQIDSNENYSLEDLIPADIPTTVYKEDTSATHAVITSAQDIAYQSRRGKGNRYAVFPDHILVWYSGDSVYDNPLVRVGNNISKSPNIKECFHRIEGINLTDDDHKILANIGLNRIA
jgi:hypothetical protein